MAHASQKTPNHTTINIRLGFGSKHAEIQLARRTEKTHFEILKKILEYIDILDGLI
jgi:hypothetical protein